MGHHEMKEKRDAKESTGKAPTNPNTNPNTNPERVLEKKNKKRVSFDIREEDDGEYKYGRDEGSALKGTIKFSTRTVTYETVSSDEEGVKSSEDDETDSEIMPSENEFERFAVQSLAKKPVTRQIKGLGQKDKSTFSNNTSLLFLADQPPTQDDDEDDDEEEEEDDESDTEMGEDEKNYRCADKLTALALADLIMNKSDAFVNDFLSCIEQQNSPATQLLKDLRAKYSPKEELEEDFSDELLDRADEFEKSAPAAKKPSHGIKENEPLICKLAMALFEQTLDKYKAARTHADAETMLSSKTCLANRAAQQQRTFKELTKGHAAVADAWSDPIEKGFRGYPTMRRAFDYIVAKNDSIPSVPWKSPDHFFKATYDVIQNYFSFCMVAFEPNTRLFLRNMEKAMRQAEKDAMERWMDGKSEEDYKLWMGYDVYEGDAFKDGFQAVTHLRGI